MYKIRLCLKWYGLELINIFDFNYISEKLSKLDKQVIWQLGNWQVSSKRVIKTKKLAMSGFPFEKIKTTETEHDFQFSEYKYIM